MKKANESKYPHEDDFFVVGNNDPQITHENIAITATAALNFDELTAYFKESLPEIQKAVGKKIHQFIGITGSGKSTLVNYMLGYKMTELQDDLGNIIAIPEAGAPACVGHDVASCTLFPGVYGAKNNSATFADCPGFFDTGTEERKIAVSMNTQLAIRAASEISSVAIVIDVASLRRGEGLSELSLLLSKLFVNHKEVKESIVFVFNKNAKATKEGIIKIINQTKKIAEENLNSYKNKFARMAGNIADLWNSDKSSEEKEKLIKYSKQIEILELMLQCQDRIVVADVFDKGESRKKIMEQLNRCKPMPKEAFDFSRYDDARVKFDRYLFNIMAQGCKIMGTCADLPKAIDDIEEEIERLDTTVLNYDQQVEALRTGKQVDLSSVDKEIADADVTIEQTELSIAELEHRIAELNDELKELDTAEPIVYWKDKLDEPRHALGIFGYSEKTFSYDELPFVNVSLDNEKGKNKLGSFSKIKSNPKHGTYSCFYQTGYYEDGYAKVSISVAKRSKPDIAARIAAIQEQIPLLNKQKENDVATLSVWQKSKTDAESRREKLIRANEHEEKSRREIIKDIEASRALLQHLQSDRQQELLALQEKLEAAEEQLEQNIELYKQIELIAQQLEFDSPLVRQFLDLYHVLSEDAAAKTQDAQPPEEFVCALNGRLMNDPVNTRCGHTFERASLLARFTGNDDGSVNCPCCAEPVKKHDWVRNHNLRETINKWRRDHFEYKQNGRSHEQLLSHNHSFSFDLFASADGLMSRLSPNLSQVMKTEKKTETRSQLPAIPSTALPVMPPAPAHAATGEIASVVAASKASAVASPMLGHSIHNETKQSIQPNIPGLIYQNVPGDGHCLYYAASLYLGQDVQTLRARVADYIQRNSTECTVYLELAKGQTSADYINDIRNGKEWAAHIDIEVLMRVFNQPIVIIGTDGRLQNQEVLERFHGEPIFVLYDGHHYDSFLRQEGFTSQQILQHLLQLNGTTQVNRGPSKG